MYDDGEDENSEPMVTVFDREAFTATCSPRSDSSYDFSLCYFGVLAQQLFQVNEKWASKQLLHYIVIVLATLHD